MKSQIAIYAKYLIFFTCTLPLPFLVADSKSENIDITKTITTWEARLEYARLLSNLHRYDESIKQYEKLLEETPGSISIQIEIAQVLYYQNKREDALKILETIPAEKLDRKGQLLMGDIYLTLKEYSKAESIYKNLLQIDPEDDLTKLKVAEMLSWQKKYQESVQLYEQILSKHPEDIQVRRKYGLVLMWMGNDLKAAEELEKTLNP